MKILMIRLVWEWVSTAKQSFGIGDFHPGAPSLTWRAGDPSQYFSAGSQTIFRGDGGKAPREGNEERKIVEFLTALALCHTVQVENLHWRSNPQNRIFIPQVADSIPEEQLGCDNESFVFDNDEEPLAWALRGRKMDFTASSPDEKVQHCFCQENLQLFFEGAGGGLPTSRSHLCWRGRGARHRQDCRLSRLWSALSQDLPPPAHP